MFAFGSRSSRLALRFASALAAVALVSTLGAPCAFAQNLPPSQPPPASARAPNGEYVAPLQQGTQETYVPQSVALSGPREISNYEEGDPIPPGYHAESKTRKGLVIGGAITFGAMWLLSVLTGAIINDVNKADNGTSGTGTFLYVPVAGPFLQMTKTDSGTGNVFLAIDGVAQAAGATMLIVGITSPKTVLVRNDLAEIRVLPMRMGTGGGGLGVVGTF